MTKSENLYENIFTDCCICNHTKQLRIIHLTKIKPDPPRTAAICLSCLQKHRSALNLFYKLDERRIDRFPPGIDWNWLIAQNPDARIKIAKGWLDQLEEWGIVYEPKKGNYKLVEMITKDNKALLRRLDKIMKTQKTYRLNKKPNGKI